jgi:hypothetical protein
MAVAVILSLFSVSTVVLALPVLDQVYAPDPDISGSAFDAMAQTFTVGITGTLTQIDVMLGRNTLNVPSGDFAFDVRTTDGVVPYLPDTGPGILGEGTIPIDDVPGGTFQDTFFGIDLTSFGIFVDSGDVLAFVGRTFRYSFSGTTTDGYTGGSAFVRSTTTGNWTNWTDISDFAIRTYVDAEPVPEPTTMLLLSSGLISLAGIARRKFKK